MASKNSEMIEKDSMSYKKSLIKSIINDLREIISLCRSKYLEKRLRTLRRRLYLVKKVANDEKKDDNEYLQFIVNVLSDIKEHYLKETKHYNHDTNYTGTESIRYLFDEDEDEDYYKPKLVSTAFKNYYLQYQTVSNRDKMLSPVKYIEEIKPNLIKLINKHKNDNWKIQLTMKINFIPVGNYNDKRLLYVKTKTVEIMMGSDKDEKRIF